MKFAGKLICGILGASIGGPIGLALGIWLGHSFDKGMGEDFDSAIKGGSTSKTQKVFFETTFAVMGHIAKADGVVTQVEINAAEQVMQRLGLSSQKRKLAIESFQQGKSPDFNLNQHLSNLVKYCIRKPSLIQMFLEIQVVAVTADRKVSPAEMQILYQIGQAFSIPKQQIDSLIEMVIAQQSFHNDGSASSRNNAVPSIDLAYKVLGVSNSTSKADIKKAYRKLMAQHHPDKLVSKGMPEEMIKVATEKSQEIQSAYDMIKKHRGF